LKKRVTSAVIMLAVSFTFVLLSPVTRVLFFALAGGLCAYEFSKSVERLEARCTLWVMFVYLAIQAALVLFRADSLSYMAAFVFCLYLALFSGVIHQRVGGKGALFTLAGLSYPCLLFGIIMAISISELWLHVLLLACISTWMCDSFALFGGMLLGKHKIAPAVSPNKTVEGCVSGAVFSVLSGLILYYVTDLYTAIPLWQCLLTALFASTMGQIGDLAESLLKRMIGVKDFSNLIPGHGGVFDRADSLLFSIPTTFFCLTLAGL